jgi:hypothetical protein
MAEPFLLFLSISNIRFGAGAASLYGSGYTKMMRFRLINTDLNKKKIKRKTPSSIMSTFVCFENISMLENIVDSEPHKNFCQEPEPHQLDAVPQ